MDARSRKIRKLKIPILQFKFPATAELKNPSESPPFCLYPLFGRNGPPCSQGDLELTLDCTWHYTKYGLQGTVCKEHELRLVEFVKQIRNKTRWNLKIKATVNNHNQATGFYFLLIDKSIYVCTVLYQGSGTMIFARKFKEHTKEQTSCVFEKILE